jgi:hypothetical protein
VRNASVGAGASGGQSWDVQSGRYKKPVRLQYTDVHGNKQGRLVGMEGIGLDGRMRFESRWVCVAWSEGICELEGWFTLVEGLRDFGGGGVFWGEDAGPSLPFNYTPKFALTVEEKHGNLKLPYNWGKSRNTSVSVAEGC